MSKIEDIEILISGKSAEEILYAVSELSSEKIVFSTSLSYEDQAITHMIFSEKLNIEVFTLDTGRLFSETYSVFNSTRDRYKQEIKTYYPKTEAVEKLVSAKGPSSFYESVENRKECCYIRKVEPL